jgi:predicted protein tyrosine phosphatase
MFFGLPFMYKTKVLFVCSRNKRRSLTAETIFAKHEQYEVKSCGTSTGSRVKITAGLVGWADVICFMEKRHKELSSKSFGEILKSKEIHILLIKDDYEYMDSKLIEKLEQKLGDLGVIV